MWPERTDPQKFVYEDIAIASYLLVRNQTVIEVLLTGLKNPLTVCKE